MYTGTLIEDLMATVARAEENVQLRAQAVEEDFTLADEVAAYQVHVSEPRFLGVA